MVWINRFDYAYFNTFVLLKIEWTVLARFNESIQRYALVVLHILWPRIHGSVTGAGPKQIGADYVAKARRLARELL